MKKIKYLTLALVCILTMASCAKQAQEQPYDIAAVQTMVDAGAFSEELEPLDADTAFALYGLADMGLSREDLTDCMVVRSAGATCEEGAVLLFSSEDQAAQAAQGLDNYIKSQIEGNVDYRPDEIPKLENALIRQRGSTLLLVVANDLDAAQKAIK